MATALATETKIVFVDEPTTGLDPISRSELWGTLTRLKKDHFIFLTTHYLEEAEKLADMIGIIDNGRLLALGTLEELRGMVRYQYSIRVLQDRITFKTEMGEVSRATDGSTQILTTEENARKLSKMLIQKKRKFSITPVSLGYLLLPREEADRGGYKAEW